MPSHERVGPLRVAVNVKHLGRVVAVVAPQIRLAPWVVGQEGGHVVAPLVEG